SAERDALHLAAARVLSEDPERADEVAAHLHIVRPAGREWCLDALRASARAALARGAPEVAVHDLRRALADPPPVEDRAGVLGELGVAEDHAGDPAAVEHLRAALDATAVQSSRAEAALTLATTL